MSWMNRKRSIFSLNSCKCSLKYAIFLQFFRLDRYPDHCLIDLSTLFCLFGIFSWKTFDEKKSIYFAKKAHTYYTILTLRRVFKKLCYMSDFLKDGFGVSNYPKFQWGKDLKADLSPFWWPFGSLCKIWYREFTCIFYSSFRCDL